MIRAASHPLAYPLTVTIGALVVIAAWAPFADLDQLSALLTVALAILLYTAFRMGIALGGLPHGAGPQRTVPVRRVRQQYRLLSRSWLEITERGRTRWLPVYFDPRLISLTGSETEVGGRRVTVDGMRLYPAGRMRETEPPGRLVDNPSKPARDVDQRATEATRVSRRLTLDAQSMVAAPFAGLLWVYVASDGITAFVGATCVAAIAALWLSAVRGSDPS